MSLSIHDNYPLPSEEEEMIPGCYAIKFSVWQCTPWDDINQLLIICRYSQGLDSVHKFPRIIVRCLSNLQSLVSFPIFCAVFKLVSGVMKDLQVLTSSASCWHREQGH